MAPDCVQRLPYLFGRSQYRPRPPVAVVIDMLRNCKRPATRLEACAGVVHGWLQYRRVYRKLAPPSSILLPENETSIC